MNKIIILNYKKKKLFFNVNMIIVEQGSINYYIKIKINWKF